MNIYIWSDAESYLNKAINLLVSGQKGSQRWGFAKEYMSSQTNGSMCSSHYLDLGVPPSYCEYDAHEVLRMDHNQEEIDERSVHNDITFFSTNLQIFSSLHCSKLQSFQPWKILTHSNLTTSVLKALASNTVINEQYLRYANYLLTSCCREIEPTWPNNQTDLQLQWSPFHCQWTSNYAATSITTRRSKHTRLYSSVAKLVHAWSFAHCGVDTVYIVGLCYGGLGSSLKKTGRNHLGKSVNLSVVNAVQKNYYLI